jgi:hypothetical protein
MVNGSLRKLSQKLAKGPAPGGYCRMSERLERIGVVDFDECCTRGAISARNLDRVPTRIQLHDQGCILAVQIKCECTDSRTDFGHPLRKGTLHPIIIGRNTRGSGEYFDSGVQKSVNDSKIGEGWTYGTDEQALPLITSHYEASNQGVARYDLAAG